LRQRESELESLDVRVAVVTFELGPLAAAYVRETNLRWPLLVDESRRLYAAYDMHQGRVWDVWGPATWWAYVKLMVKGRLPRRPHSDVNQLGGDVLVDPAGVVRLHHVGNGPADRPSVQSLLDVVSSSVKRKPNARS